MEIVIWLGFCAAVGYYANSKGRSAILWGLLAFVISPLLAGLALALMKDKDIQQDISQLRMNQQMMHDRISSNEKMNEARFSQVNAQLAQQQQNAQLAQQQNARLAQQQQQLAQQQLPQQSGTAAAQPVFCGNCGAQLEPGATFCAECGARVEGR
ncbi:MAG: zinc ribbon domain-containing protein [Selenomonas sp.]|jgi:hypothetical protein|nr:zinc ribbon domain-containing protein [Selenomonas sp.]HBT80069.1 hypothetical protein [Selenomonas sp.]